MGANEKHSATYHGGEYRPMVLTPPTHFVRGAYIHDRIEVGTATQAEANDEFTRWLETVRAEAKAEAWDEGAEAEASTACMNPPCGVCDGCCTPVENPYKETE